VSISKRLLDELENLAWELAHYGEQWEPEPPPPEEEEDTTDGQVN
jgi:hypothetical protein